MRREYPGIGMNKREEGSRYEAKAERYLLKHGFRILERNFRCRSAEVDLVAAEGKYLVFVEVKQRSSARYGAGAEAVNAVKQRRICRAARYYLYVHRMPENTPVRFDVVSIDAGRIRLIRGAFQMKM